MSDGILTQEEIDALLNSSALADELEGPGKATDGLTDQEKQAVGETVSVVMESAAASLGTLVDREVEISGPVIEITNPETIQAQCTKTWVIGKMEFAGGLAGVHALMIEDRDAAVIVDLMMGGEGQAPQPVGDNELETLKEAFNQMMNTGASAISSVVREEVELVPPEMESKDLSVEALGGYLGQRDQTLVRISFRLTVQPLIDSEIVVLYPLGLAKSLAQKVLGAAPKSSKPPAQVSAGSGPSLHQTDSPPREPVISNPVPSGGYAPSQPSFAQQVPVQPVQFAPLQQGHQAKDIANIDLIMDVPLQITVELGKTKKTIKEILALGPGSVVELDKLAGEPVDLLVNGKLLAKGEVVVIDENFGIRVSDIISPIERISSLQ